MMPSRLLTVPKLTKQEILNSQAYAIYKHYESAKKDYLFAVNCLDHLATLEPNEANNNAINYFTNEANEKNEKMNKFFADYDDFKRLHNM